MANEEINLMEYYRVVRRKIRLILMIIFGVTLASVIYSLCLPKIYRTQAVILPLGNNNSGLGGLGGVLASQFQSISALSGANAGGGVGSKIMAILNSFTLSENLIQRNNLLKVFFKDGWDSVKQQWKSGKPPSMEAAVGLFRGMLSFSDDKKSGMLTIYVSDKDPAFAKKMVNAVLVELQHFISDKELSEAKRRRVFIEKQLLLSKKELLEMGKNLTQVYQREKISPLSTMFDVSLDEETLSGENIDHEIADLNQKKEALDKAVRADSLVRDVPQQVYMDYITQRRQVLIALVNLLSQQYATSKIDEAREDISFQVIDAPRIPERRFKPERKKIVFKAFLASFFFALLFVLLKEYYLDQLFKKAK